MWHIGRSTQRFLMVLTSILEMLHCLRHEAALETLVQQKTDEEDAA